MTTELRARGLVRNESGALHAEDQDPLFEGREKPEIGWLKAGYDLAHQAALLKKFKVARAVQRIGERGTFHEILDIDREGARILLAVVSVEQSSFGLRTPLQSYYVVRRDGDRIVATKGRKLLCRRAARACGNSLGRTFDVMRGAIPVTVLEAQFRDTANAQPEPSAAPAETALAAPQGRYCAVFKGERRKEFLYSAMGEPVRFKEPVFVSVAVAKSFHPGVSEALLDATKLSRAYPDRANDICIVRLMTSGVSEGLKRSTPISSTGIYIVEHGPFKVRRMARWELRKRAKMIEGADRRIGKKARRKLAAQKHKSPRSSAG